VDYILFIKLIVGLVLLAWGADIFVNSAIAIARYKKWSASLVGGVLLGCATTLPEMLVSLFAIIHKNVGLSLGNAVGSYMANIGMVLGGVAIIKPLKVNAALLKRDLPIMTFSVLLLTILLLDYYLGRFDGAVLLFCLACLVFMVYKNPHASVDDSVYHLENISTDFNKSSFFMLVLGFLMLIKSSEIVVNSAAAIANFYQVSDLTIGLTIVAVGTSLPEFVTSLCCALRKEYAMAIGNVFGSNIFGILGVVAIPGLFAPGKVDYLLVWRDCIFMLGITSFLWLLVYRCILSDFFINRLYGVLLVVLFSLYLFDVAK